MVESSSAGKKLNQARIAKRLTIDEVAHATKLRPDKIVALENDDYSRFGSIAYGKGFLQIYARYLEVDLSEQLRHMEIPSNSVSISDYQYLNTTPPPAPRKARDRSLERGGARRERRPPSVLPLVVVLSIGAVGLWGFYRMNAARIPTLEAPLSAPATPAPAAIPAAPRANPPQAGDEKPSAPQNKIPSLAQPVQPTSDAAFLASVNPPPASRATDVDDAAAGALNELIVEPLKKTWVKIHKNSPDSPPIFEDYLYPGARALKLRGARFFVEVRDQSAVQIRKNGHPIAYQSPGISIQ